LLRVIFLAAVVAVTAGCGSGDLTLDQADPDAVAAQPQWEQVFSTFQLECAPCHTDNDDNGEDQRTDGSAAVSRAGGAEPDLTTCIGIIENLDSSIERIFVSNDMPPGAWPRLSSEERLIIRRWLDQGGQAPCK
jgi:mono/diheme cytochrome c family protein